MPEFGTHPDGIGKPDHKVILPAGKPRKYTVTGRTRDDDPPRKRKEQSNTRIETLQRNGIEVAINATYPDQEKVTTLITTLQEHGGIPAEWSRMEHKFGAKAYYRDDVEHPTFFAKVRLLPEESGVREDNPDPERGRKELKLAPKIREFIASNEVQQLAIDALYTGVSLVEPLASYTDPDGRQVMIYPWQEGHQSPETETEEVPEPESVEGRLTTFLMRLRAHFLTLGIYPDDIALDQLILSNEAEGNQHLYLTDIEKYKEVTIPTLNGNLIPIKPEDILPVDSDAPPNTTEPLILPVTPDITLIAANNFGVQSGTLFPRFSNAINAANYIIMQGPNGVIKTSYADLAVEYAEKTDKQILLFNEEQDPTQKAVEAGMSPDLAGFYTVFPLILSHIQSGTIRNWEQPNVLQDVLELLHRTSQVYRDMPEDKLRYHINKWKTATIRALSLFETFSGMNPVQDFLANIRDVAMITPDTIELIKNLPGQKVLLVDPLTSPALVQALKGTLPQSQSWREFAHDLTPDAKIALQEFLISLNLTDPVVSRLRPKRKTDE